MAYTRRTRGGNGRRAPARRASGSRRSTGRTVRGRSRSPRTSGGVMRLVIETASPSVVARPYINPVGIPKKPSGRAKL